MSAKAFADRLASDGVSEEVAGLVYRALIGWCSPGILPHPDDALIDFYGLDADHQEDVVEEAFRAFRLPMPTPRGPERIPELLTARDLALYLESCRRRPGPEMQEAAGG